MKRVLLSAFVLAGCNMRPDPDAEHLSRMNDTTITNPPGRYQMLPAGNFSTDEPQIVVLDTREGRVSRCTVRADGVDCVAFKPVG